MKFTILILSTLLLTISVPSYAATSTSIVHVNGLVCDFCARAIEKVFGEKKEVQAVKVDLDKKIITLDFKDHQKLDDATITKLVTDAGYNVVSIDKDGGAK
jgi:copper chaperone CopZ